MLLADDKKDEKKSKDEEAILGTWKVEKFDSGGINEPKLEELANLRMTFTKDGKLSMNDDLGRKREVDYKLDPAPKPKAIDMGADGTTIPGLYSLDGDTLILCAARGVSDGKKLTRPTEIKADGKAEVAVITLKRVKDEKKEEKKDR